MIPAFPKIFTINTRHVQNIFDDEYERFTKLANVRNYNEDIDNMRLVFWFDN